MTNSNMAIIEKSLCTVDDSQVPYILDFIKKHFAKKSCDERDENGFTRAEVDELLDRRAAIEAGNYVVHDLIEVD